MTTEAFRTAEDDADDWVVRMHSDQVTLDDERRFADWLASDPSHSGLYERANALWSQLGALRLDPAVLHELADVRERPRRNTATPSRRGLLAASLVGGVAVTGGWLSWDTLFRSTAYATGLGEQQSIVLDDGSRVTLNTDSALRVRFDQRERRVWLDKGQAFFAVTADAGRPFRVFVGTDEMRAGVTTFDVRRMGDEARLALESGRLEVFRGGRERKGADARRSLSPGPIAILQSGDQAIIASRASVAVTQVDKQDIGTWRFGRMVLDEQPLGNAVAEINRYNARQIIVADPSLDAMPISGVFQTGKPEAFVEALEAAFPVRVQSRTAHTIALVRRERP